MTALGATIIRRLPIIQSVSVRLPERSLARLAALPFAAHLSYDGLTKKSDAFTCGSSGASYAYQQYGLTGQGVGVAIVDSGIRYCSDLDVLGSGTPRVRAAISFVPGSTSTDDLCGHGTHVAGIAGGNGALSTGPNYSQTFYGVARDANLINVRVLDQNGASSVSTVISGLQWVISHKAQYNIRVVNLSLGHPVGESYTTDPICQTVEALYKAGIVVVCAAGNEGRVNGTLNTPGLDNEGWGTSYGSIQSPGNDPYVITVGATKSMDGIRADDRIATYSSRGPSRLDLVMKPDIVAPGNRVISLYSYNSTLFQYDSANGNNLPARTYEKTTWTGNSTDYFQLSGTSMASPVVAGAVALMLQANPSLTPDTIKARLMLSADKWYAADGTADPLTYGAGYLDIPAALASAAVAQGPAASPALLMNSAADTMTVDLSRAMWGSSLWGTGIVDLRAMWGSHAMWGSASISSSRAMWGSNTVFAANQAMLGGSTVSAERAMWGCSVWSDHAMWGCSSTAVDLSAVALTGE